MKEITYILFYMKIEKLIIFTFDKYYNFRVNDLHPGIVNLEMENEAIIGQKGWLIEIYKEKTQILTT